MNIYNVKMLVKYVLICDIFFEWLQDFLFVLEKGYFLKKYQQFSINFIFVCLFFVICMVFSRALFILSNIFFPLYDDESVIYFEFRKSNFICVWTYVCFYLF